MMSMLFIGLGAHLRGGLLVWHQATQRTEALQRRRAFFDRLERDLAGAFVYDSREEAYGEPAGLLPPPSFGAERLTIFTVEAAAEGLPSVRIVRYRCDEQGGVRGVWRSSQSLGEVRARIEPAAELILEGADALSFEYASLDPKEQAALIWGPLESSETLKLPRLIKATVEAPGGSRWERVCVIPAGALPKPSAS
jgi:hypothetical protein